MFAYDQADVRPSEMSKTSEIAAYMKQNPSLRLGIDGDTDTRGTNRYNANLNERRMGAVRDALIQAGVPADRIEAGAFGQARSNCNDATPQCWQRDGRVEVLVRSVS
jgi:outer membrane protein OmpA-like peptidoglycan-associated protein